MLTRAALRAFSTEALKVVNNVPKQQFTISLDGNDAVLTYEQSGKDIIFLHTEVPDQFKGKGVGKLLAEHAFAYAINEKLDVICKCNFLAAYYEKNATKYKNLKVKVELE